MSANAAIKGRRPARAGKAAGFLMLAMLVISGVALMPTTLLFVVGMIPTFTAFVCDQSERRSTTLTIGFMNGAGIVPFAIELWMRGQTLEHSFALLKDPMTCLVAYCAAGTGWLIYFSVPPIVGFFLAQSVRMHIGELEERQMDLRRLWGDEVRPTPASHGPSHS